MRRSALLLLLAMALAACSKTDMTDLKQFVADVKARPPGGISPAPELVETETYVYVPGDRRDPFRPQENAQGESTAVVDSGIKPDFNRRREELENYSLDSLRMVGTLEQDNHTWGLVKTNDGTIHRVAPGNHMGRNYGKIVEIAEDKIKLIELVQVGSGYKEQEAALGLGEDGK
jgi:type IV pilus assembly protein PilP